MTNKEILKRAMEQSAEDIGCSADDFIKSENVVTRFKLGANARKYYTEPIIGNFVSYGSNAVIAVQDDMWQIGVDVLPEYRRKGIASAITSRLAVEILNRGKIPFYCTAWSNIRSVRNAVKSGFIPAWAEMTIKTKEFVEEAIKDKEVEENDN